MKYVEIEDLIDLSLGATLLGSGGGGCPDYDLLMAEKHFMDYGKARLADVDELQKGDLVVPIAFAGAPLVAKEVLPSGLECEILLKSVEEVLGKKPSYILPAEIGGANALCPFIFSSRLNIPVLDADTLGRAFPELQMSSCHLFGVSPSPAFVVDSLGNHVVIKAMNANMLEALARQAIVAMGSSALVGIYLMDGEQTQRSVIKGTITQAMQLGKAIRQAKAQGKNPIHILESGHGARVLGQGVITQIHQSIEKGFLNGIVSISTDKGIIEVDYQNEYLKVDVNKSIEAITPEIIVLLDSESFQPITSEMLLYGLRVTVLSLHAPDIWNTKEGLKLVGPNYFGYKS
jgi:uncharacterized protein